MHSELEELLVEFAGEQDFSGVCLVTQDDRTLLHKAYGLAHRGFGIPNSVTTRFDIASITKLFTAAAILQLVESGRLSFDTRVAPSLGLAGTTISDDVTIYHCLTHTSGIGDDADEEAGEEYEALFIDTPNYSVRETSDFIPQCTTRDAVFLPGNGVRYNNCAFVLLGLVIEHITNKPYRTYIQENIFEPAQMIGADFCAMDGVCPELAEHYKRIENENGEVSWRRNIYSYPPIGSPDGGATVTALDLVQFMKAIQNNRILGSVMSHELLEPRVKYRGRGNRESWYGYGFQFETDVDSMVLEIGKDGINAGVASYFGHYPQSGHTCVLLANQDCNVWQMIREMRSLLGIS